MASFIDTLPTFKEYVQQFPVEAAVRVGTYKQGKYDEGIQKIQQHIDNVAGIDVVRDVDKQYLQSKLNELGGNLKKVAAGDFSNYQLVNSVGGMITQVSRDKNIQNAVGSTAKYRKGVSEMEVARKEGKSSPSNEYVFNRQVEQWLNDTNVESSFNGSYKSYSNWKKNGLELLKALTKDETITDDAFTVDSKGQLVIADAVVRKKLAGVSPEKIQQALMVGLSPADFEQMGIDGVYNFANVSDAQFANNIQQSNVSTVNFYNDQKKILENAKSSTTSVVEKQKLNDQITALDKIISSVNSEYADVFDALRQGNSDGARAQYFTRNAIDGFAKAFSYTEASQTYQNSPFAEAERWRQDKAQDWNKFLLKYEQDERGHALKQKELKQGEGYGGLPVGVKQEDVPRYTLDRIVQETKEKALTVQAVDANFIQTQGKDKQWLDQQKQAWEKSPASVSPIVAEHLALTEKMRRDALSDIVMITDIEKQAVDTYGDIYQHIPKNAPSIRAKIQGQEVSYSPREIVDFNNDFSKYISLGAGSFVGSTGFGGGKGTVYDYERAEKELSPKAFLLFQMMGGAIPPNKDVLNALQEYSKVVNQPYSETINKINKYTADEVSKRLTMNQGVAYGLPTGNAEQKASIATTLSQFADLADSQNGALPNSPNFDSETARKLASVDAKYSLTVVEGTERQPAMYEMSVSGKSGDNTLSTSFKVTPEQKAAIFGERYESSPKIQAVQPYLEQMRKMGGYSTAYTKGPSTPENAYLSKIDFPSASVYGVKGNIVTLSPESGRYTIKLNIFDPVTKTWHNDIDYPRTGMISKEALNDALRMLNDAAIYELINERPATANDLKLVESASKKPL